MSYPNIFLTLGLLTLPMVGLCNESGLHNDTGSRNDATEMPTQVATEMPTRVTAIDRHALVSRNNPHVSTINPLYALTLGNGRFAFTADATGLQTFPEHYYEGLTLGTFSQWGWHSFPNVEGYSVDETLAVTPLPGQNDGIYAVSYADGPERNRLASEWFRANPHRMHLGNVGFAGMAVNEIDNIDQTLDMWTGELQSTFKWRGETVRVITFCHGERDEVSAIVTSKARPAITLRFPYPTGEAVDGAACWTDSTHHSTTVVLSERNRAVLRREVDSATYFVEVTWSGKAQLKQCGINALTLTPKSDQWSFNVGFYESQPASAQPDAKQCQQSSRDLWLDYWSRTGVVDFSACTDPRAPRLESRVVKSQYLMRAQEAQDYPPAETGLTYNTWFGKFHLEMLMWHSFQFAQWNMPELLERQLRWFKSAMPTARQIAERQGFPGVRWMKMTDPSATEAPSDIGSFLIWQQPHVIYMAELIYRNNHSEAFLREYADMVDQTAQFMAAFLKYDAERDRYIIQGACAAAEKYRQATTVNPAFELAYYHFALSVAQQWRERLGEQRRADWDVILQKLSPVASSPEGIYLPAESGQYIPDYAHDPYADTIYVRATSPEHISAYGVLPYTPVIDLDKMEKTLLRANENWDWKNLQSGWNFPTLAMNATRLMHPEIALRAITVNDRADICLPGGNNYRSQRLRSYLPSNGGLLLAISLMCAGWDGCPVSNPGFPHDGTWDVRWEGLMPMP